MRRALSAIATCLAIIAVWAAPVSADPPAEFEFTVEFTDVNPCTGLDHVVTITNVVRLHEHGERVVAHLSRTGTTDSGYVMDHGVEQFVDNGNVLTDRFTDNWRDSEGSSFKAQGVFVLDLRTGEVRVDRFRLRCVTA